VPLSIVKPIPRFNTTCLFLYDLLSTMLGTSSSIATSVTVCIVQCIPSHLSLIREKYHRSWGGVFLWLPAPLSGYICLYSFYRTSYALRSICHGPVSVCLFVCVSVTSRCSTKMTKHRNTQITPHDNPGTLVNDAKNIFEIRTGLPATEATNADGVGRSWRMSTNNSPCLENGKR